MTGRLADKVVVVIGAGAQGEGWGNGKASAVTYAREGARVVCADLHLDRAQATVDVIEAEGGQAVAVAADATQEASVAAVMQAAVAAFGHIDALHSNVGVGGARGRPDEVTPEAFQREIDQNLTSAYLGTRCAIPHLRANGGGAILNTSSLLAVRFLRRVDFAYTVAKAGVEALTKASAVSYGREGIRVNCVRIGFSETPLVLAGVEQLSAERREVEMAKSRAKVPLRQEHGDAFDVAEAGAYLLSDAAKHVTGVVLDVDGGLSIAPI